jgi:hypothetical protein
MGKAFAASACGLLVLLTGCGSSGGKGEDLKTACTNTLRAQKEYRTAGGRVGLDFSNRPAELQLITAIDALRTQVQSLAPLTTGAQRQRLEAFAPALGQQQKIFKALVAGNRPEAEKYAGGLNEPALDAGRKTIEQVCSKTS